MKISENSSCCVIMQKVLPLGQQTTKVHLKAPQTVFSHKLTLATLVG